MREFWYPGRVIALKTVATPEVDVGARPVIAAIGAFDGLHLGHRQLFETALKIKAGTGLPVMVIGFHPHPKSLVKPGGDYESLLTPMEEKQALLEDMGIDYFWPIHFTREMSQLSPREFTRMYLRDKIQADHVVCGFNFTFGYKAEGNPQVLHQIGQDMGFEVSVVPPYTIDGEVVSSTRIRRLLSEGDVERAAVFLDRPYCIYGDATGDNETQSQAGMPVFRLSFPQDKFLPKPGVYAVWARTSRFLKPAVASLRTNLTSGETRAVLQVYVGAIPASRAEGMQLFLMKHIREERQFELGKQAGTQIKVDYEAALAALKPQGQDFHDKGLFTRISAYDKILSADIP